MNRTLLRTRAARWALVGVLLAGMLAACGDDDDDESAGAAADKVTLQAGVNDPNDPTIAVTEFLPAAITVAPGTTVEWTLAGPEPHSVTFVPEGDPAPNPEDEAWFAPTPPTGPFDGSTMVNSGLGPLGPNPFGPFELEFSTVGEYSYSCVIHPLMTGTVTVATDGADTQDEINTRGDAEMAEWLADGRAAKKKLTEAAPATTKNADGSTDWKLSMGITTEHTDVLAFSPASAEIAPGDSVTFVNDTHAPHTATFANGGPAPMDPTSDEAATPVPGGSPQTLTNQGLFNTGILPPNAPPGAGPPESVRSYTYKIPAAGSYTYICIFHIPSGMAGAITVA